MRDDQNKSTASPQNCHDNITHITTSSQMHRCHDSANGEAPDVNCRLFLRPAAALWRRRAPKHGGAAPAVVARAPKAEKPCDRIFSRGKIPKVAGRDDLHTTADNVTSWRDRSRARSFDVGHRRRGRALFLVVGTKKCHRAHVNGGVTWMYLLEESISNERISQIFWCWRHFHTKTIS